MCAVSDGLGYFIISDLVWFLFKLVWFECSANLHNKDFKKVKTWTDRGRGSLYPDTWF